MSQSMSSSQKQQIASAARWQAVALPAEHGSWSLVIEPIFLGLLVAPTWGGVLLGLAAFFAFLAHQPLKVLWLDYKRGRSYKRTRLAQRFVLFYSLLAAVCLAGGVWLAGLRPLLPFLFALPLILVFAVYDQRPGRHWQAELSAPVASAGVAAAVALAAGWPLAASIALWVVMAARAAPAVLYVRSRLRLIKEKPAQRKRAWTAHVLAVLVVGVLVWVELLPETAVFAMLILLGRALLGLSKYRRSITTKALGFLEMGFGFLTAVLVAIGYWIS